MHETLTALLAKHSEIQLAILFGSQATGLAGPDSDIDLAIMSKQTLSADDKLKLVNEIADQLGRPVDLVDLRTAGEPLLGQILKGSRLLGDDSCYARLLTRHLIDSADFLPLQQRILKERRDAWINS